MSTLDNRSRGSVRDIVFHDRSKTKAQSGDVDLHIEVVLGPPETLSSNSPGIAVKAHAEMLLGASPQFVESPWAVAGLSSRNTANGTARGATVDRNVVPCVLRHFISQNQRWKTRTALKINFRGNWKFLRGAPRTLRTKQS